MDEGDCTVEELLAAYAGGQRLFADLELPENADMSGCCLESASFHHCGFLGVSLKGANLRGAAFRCCYLKCVDFDDADLTDALIEEKCSVENITARRSKIGGLRVRNCCCYGSDSFGLESFIKLAVNAPEEKA
ncbi:MAG: hypothetical protein B7Z37_28675 [Verrucomicrobia bacterium 12-59-8]|nr:MAG: hypothetical protein B7Z37_28675 [Verrucomicrobia bacterium 12-59-8]